MRTPWQVQLMGRLRAQRGGQVIERFPTRKTGYVLAAVALDADRSVRREVLIESFWPDSAPAAGRNSLSRALSGLRRLMEGPDERGSVIDSDRFRVALVDGCVETDVDRLVAGWSAIDAAGNDRDLRVERMRAAVERYGGDLLPDADGEWVDTLREELRRRQLRTLEALSESLIETGVARDAADFARRAVDLDPLRESAHRLTMRALMADGRQAEAADHYRSLERLLLDELDVAPSDQTRALVEELVASGQGRPPPRADTPTGSGTGVASHPREPSPTPGAGGRVQRGVSTVLAVRFGGEGDQSHGVAAVLRELRRILGALDGEVIRAGAACTTLRFVQTSDAVAAAQSVVRHAAAHAELAVAIGIHTGEGPAVPSGLAGEIDALATGVADVAADRRIVLTEEAAVLVRHALDDDVRLADLGRFRLAEGRSHHRLFELRTDRASEDPDDVDVPAVRITAEQTSDLPVRLSRFVGRQSEQGQLLELLDDPTTRLTTLTGMGGTGKTRLALEVAREWERRSGWSATWIELDGVRDARQLGRVLAARLGLVVRDPREAKASVVHHLSDGPHLLVFDNFEQLVEDGAVQIRELLLSCSDLRVLITSRIRLGLEGEQEVALRPLPVPDVDRWVQHLADVPSVQLLVDRARLVHPGFALTAENGADVARLCAALEGIPLAIELAAARMSVMAPGQMLGRISDRLRWLADRRADLGPRQRSLRGAFDWSYELLSADARDALGAVAIFRGSWSIEAGEAVLADPMAVERIAELRDASLIQSQPGPDGVHFSMLESLRLYAGEKLDPEDERAYRRRHARFYMERAEEAKHALTGPDQRVWIERLTREDDDLWAALEHCASDAGDPSVGLRLACGLQYYWFTRAMLRGGLEAMEALLERADATVAVELRAQALRVAGGLASYLGELNRAEPYLAEALALQRELDDPWGVPSALYQMAMLRYQQGDHPSARSLVAKSNERFREQEGDRSARGRAAALNLMGMIDRKHGDLDAARRHYEEALQLLRDVGDRQGATNVLHNLARIDVAHGALDSAEARAREVADIAHQVGNDEGLLDALRILSRVAEGRGEDRRAVRMIAALRAAEDFQLEATTAADHEEFASSALSALRDRMDRPVFDSEIAAGGAMSRDGVLAWLLGDPGHGEGGERVAD